MKKKSESYIKILLGKEYFVYGVFLFITLIILASWYRYGKFIGGGEAGLQFWDIGRYINLNRFPWVERGLGIGMVTSLPKMPLLYLINLFPAFNIPWFHQAIFFFITISTGLVSVYFSTLEMTSSRDKLVGFIAALFYLLNPYTVSQIFGRFIYAGMLAWGFLPLFLYILLRWLRGNNNILKVAIIVLVFIFYSFVFAQPSYILALWIAAFLILLSKSFVIKKDRIKLFWRFIVFFSLWCVVNIWWLYPYTKVGSVSLGINSAFEYNFASLRGVSQFATSPNILTLKQGYYIGKGGYFFPYYSQLLITALSDVVLFVVIVGWIKSRKELFNVHLTLLAFAGWFVSKGTNPPLGHIFFQNLFRYIPITYGLRNPYEKFGSVWLLSYSILFALGSSWVMNKYGNKWKKDLFIGASIFSCIVLGLPIINGTVYRESLFIKVPDYYKTMNNILDNDGGDGRVLLMPIQKSDGITYAWGYDGLEPAEDYINRPVLGEASILPVYSGIMQKLELLPVTDDDFYEMLKDLNVSYIIFNGDYLYPSGDKDRVDILREQLLKNANLIKIDDYGALTLYRYQANKAGSQFDAISDKPPDIEYIKSSPIKYKVIVRNAEKNFALVFKSTYDKHWTAIIDGEKVEKHDIIYGYANLWQISKKGNYTIDVVFKLSSFN